MPFFARAPDWLRAPPSRPPRRFTVALMWAFIFFASIFDALGTALFLAAGGEEANPVMAWLIARSAGTLFAVKFIVVPLLAFLLYRLSARHRLAWGGFVLVTIVHIGLTAMHQWITLPLLASP